jgi:hypothetical protein
VFFERDHMSEQTNQASTTHRGSASNALSAELRRRGVTNLRMALENVNLNTTPEEISSGVLALLAGRVVPMPRRRRDPKKLKR